MQRPRGGPSSTPTGTAGSGPDLRLRSRAALRVRVFAAAVVVVALVVLGSLVSFLWSPGPGGLGELCANSVTPLSAGTAALLAALAARRASGRLRRAWSLMAAASLCWAGAETGFVIRYLSTDVLPVGPDDALFLLATPLGIAAVASFPVPQWQGADRWRAVLDGVIVAGSVVFVARGLGVLARGEGSWSAQLVASAYPLGDVVLLSVALVGLVRAERAAYGRLGLVVLGMGVYCVGDVVYALRVRAGSYAVGTPVDLTWILGYLMIALAALAPAMSGDRRAPVVHATYRGRTVPWVLVGGALVAVVLVAAGQPEAFSGDPVMTASCLVVLAVFCLRQAWLFRDQARLNRTLQRESERRAQITGALLDGVLVLDGRGRVCSANPAAAALLGAEAEALVGTPLVGLLRTDDHDRGRLQELVRALHGETVVTQAEATFARPDDREIVVELSVGPLDPTTQLGGVVVVFRDVTQRRAVERMKNEFMSVISHELRTPLTSVRGAMALLNGGLGGPLEPSGARLVSIALQSSERISRLLNDILDVERLESGVMRLELAEHDARALVDCAVHEMGGLAAQAKVQVVTGTVAGRVRADDDRVVQTLTNLIGNAVKFSPAGTSVIVSARAEGDEVEFAVVDRGRGIPADKLTSVFDRFEQVDSSDARLHGGTGLGLAICSNIVRLHGGRIWVTSRLGEGATFRFTLPRAADGAGPAGPAPATAPLQAQSAGLDHR